MLYDYGRSTAERRKELYPGIVYRYFKIKDFTKTLKKFNTSEEFIEQLNNYLRRNFKFINDSMLTDINQINSVFPYVIMSKMIGSCQTNRNELDAEKIDKMSELLKERKEHEIR